MKALAIVLALLAGHMSSAHADENGANIDLQAFRPAVDSKGLITIDGSQVLMSGALSLGLVTNWGRGVLRFEEGENVYEVENLVSPTLVAAIGLKPGGIDLELGVSLPFAIISGDRGPDSDGGTPSDPNDDRSYRFEGQGLADIGVHLKWRFLRPRRAGGLGAALITSLKLPTASEEDRWLGDDGVSGRLIGVLDREFGRVRLAANGGVSLRSKKTAYTDTGSPMMGTMPVTGGTIEAGSTLPFGAGAAYALSPESFDVVAEIFGEVPLAGENYFPLEAIGGAKLYLARNSFLTFGAGVGLSQSGASPNLRAFLGIVFEPNIGDRDGDGIKDDLDHCPDDPEDYDDFEDEDGCPELDNDSDGILDVDDECPNDPEDRDGIEDEDGCPEGGPMDRDGDKIIDENDHCPDDPEDYDDFEDKNGCPDFDNDRDRILDIDDLCPNDPEDRDGWDDDDGCPDPDNDGDRILDVDDECPNRKEVYNTIDDEDGCPDTGGTVIDSGSTIDILDKIHFEFDSAVIKPVSFEILEAVAMTIITNPDIKRVEVQGHTDERGSDVYNLKLSQRRAEAVVEFLTSKGLEENRLFGQGYGETDPIDKRHNEAAWKKNRRVEFIILERD